MSWNGFRGAAKRLDDIDLPRVGRLIGVGEDEVHAVLEVESRGSGFDRQGRPAMLFEPHVFWRELGPGPKRDRAARAGLAYAKWKPGTYPRDSYPRLEQAIEIDETAALKSASWGLPQILGDNHEAAGYATPQAMVRAFMADEEAQLEAMIRFIKANRLDDNLRAHDWAGFARGYNGQSYARHGYHTRLETAFNKWRRIRDTPYDPRQDVRESAAVETLIRDKATPDVTFPPPVREAPKPAPASSQPTRPAPAPAKPAGGFWAAVIRAFNMIVKGTWK